METVYRGRVFSVEVGAIALPNGKRHEIAIVRHPPSVVLIPMLDPGHVVLISQYRHSVGRTLWELPAGSVDPGESSEAAAARECEEEIAMRPGRIERVASFYPTPGFCDEELIFFRVSDLQTPPADSPHKPDDDEDIHVQTFTVTEARAMVASGAILDLKTAYRPHSGHIGHSLTGGKSRRRMIPVRSCRRTAGKATPSASHAVLRLMAGAADGTSIVCVASSTDRSESSPASLHRSAIGRPAPELSA